MLLYSFQCYPSHIVGLCALTFKSGEKLFIFFSYSIQAIYFIGTHLTHAERKRRLTRKFTIKYGKNKDSNNTCISGRMLPSRKLKLSIPQGKKINLCSSPTHQDIRTYSWNISLKLLLNLHKWARQTTMPWPIFYHTSGVWQAKVIPRCEFPA